MNELEAKCYLTKQGGANNSDQHCIYVRICMYIYIDNKDIFLSENP